MVYRHRTSESVSNGQTDQLTGVGAGDAYPSIISTPGQCPVDMWVRSDMCCCLFFVLQICYCWGVQKKHFSLALLTTALVFMYLRFRSTIVALWRGLNEKKKNPVHHS